MSASNLAQSLRCPVSLEVFSPRPYLLDLCGHTIGSDAVVQLFQRSIAQSNGRVLCPVCQKPLSVKGLSINNPSFKELYFVEFVKKY
jgi:hypothetical protein